ncbi:MAG: hypothetical protein GXO86_09165 [Chlorobi bacterium]|nr:hypothetical protein [Chlorobiota bacterium]
MKTVTLTLIALIALSLAVPVTGQTTSKAAEKEMKSRAYKQARKDAKKYRKEGFYVAPGALPLDKQLEKSWTMQYETDKKGNPKYFVASGNSVAETQTAAKLQAGETAKLNLAGQISTSIAGLIENSIANQQLSAEEAASVTKTVAASKNLIAQKLGRVLTTVEMYKKMGNNIESNIFLAYNYQMALETGKKVIRQQLEEQTNILHEKLDKILNL